VLEAHYFDLLSAFDNPLDHLPLFPYFTNYLLLSQLEHGLLVVRSAHMAHGTWRPTPRWWCGARTTRAASCTPWLTPRRSAATASTCSPCTVELSVEPDPSKLTLPRSSPFQANPPTSPLPSLCPPEPPPNLECAFPGRCLPRACSATPECVDPGRSGKELHVAQIYSVLPAEMQRLKGK
jgi:hypothetical protein